MTELLTLTIKEGSANLHRKLVGLNHSTSLPIKFVWSLYSATTALAVVHLLLLKHILTFIFQIRVLWELSMIKHQRSTCHCLPIKRHNSTYKQQHIWNRQAFPKHWKKDCQTSLIHSSFLNNREEVFHTPTCKKKWCCASASAVCISCLVWILFQQCK